MHRKFIALIVTAAIVITGSSAPARADSDDVAKLLAGLTVLAIIGAALEDRRDDRYPHYRPSRPVPVEPLLYPRPVPPRVINKVLPAECLRPAPNIGPNARVLGKRCLVKSYRHADKLPRKCRVEFQGRHKMRTGYRVKCLRKKGYRLSGHYQPYRPAPIEPPLKPRPVPPRLSKMVLPAQCLRVVPANGENTRILGKRCLMQNYRHADKLPRKCRVEFQGRHETRKGYRVQCLRNKGYRLSLN